MLTMCSGLVFTITNTNISINMIVVYISIHLPIIIQRSVITASCPTIHRILINQETRWETLYASVLRWVSITFVNSLAREAG